MKTSIYLLIALNFYCSAVYSYGGPPPAPPLFKAKYTGSVYHAPLITGNNNNVFWAGVSYNAVSELDGKIKLECTGSNPLSSTKDKNFEWQTPSTIINFGISTHLSENSAIILKLDFGKMKNWNIEGIEAAYCGLIVNSDNHKARILLGINIHRTDFHWYTDSSNYYLSKNGAELDPAFSIIYNTDFKNWTVNPFVQLSYSWQSLYDSGAKEYSSDVYRYVNVFSFSPGIIYKWRDNINFAFSVSFSYVDNIKNSRNFVLTPQLQMLYYF